MRGLKGSFHSDCFFVVVVNTIYLLGFGYVSSLLGIIANNGLVRISRDCSRRASALAQQDCGHDL